MRVHLGEGIVPDAALTGAVVGMVSSRPHDQIVELQCSEVDHETLQTAVALAKAQALEKSVGNVFASNKG